MLGRGTGVHYIGNIIASDFILRGLKYDKMEIIYELVYRGPGVLLKLY